MTTPVSPEIPSFLPGVTITLALADFKQARGSAPITSGAVVTFAVERLDGGVVATNQASFDAGEWIVSLNAPATPASYRVIATAVVDGQSTWQGVGFFIVEPLR